MRRFWLLLLLLVMPLQMSWAAVHLCDDASAGWPPIVTDGGPDEHLHPAGTQDQEQGSHALGDGCCASAHGCHGLHNLMAQQAWNLPGTTDFAKPVAREVRHPRLEFAYRLERPQWLAA